MCYNIITVKNKNLPLKGQVIIMTKEIYILNDATFNHFKNCLKTHGYKLKTIDLDRDAYYWSNGKNTVVLLVGFI